MNINDINEIRFFKKDRLAVLAKYAMKRRYSHESFFDSVPIDEFSHLMSCDKGWKPWNFKKDIKEAIGDFFFIAQERKDYERKTKELNRLKLFIERNFKNEN